MIFPKIYIEFERWRKHKETGYYISNLGNIRDTNKKKVEPLVDNRGYFCIIINDKRYMVHRLSAECWCRKNSEEDITVDHIDSNKRNNKAKNLQWVSSLENFRRADEKFLNEDGDNITLAARRRAKEIEKITVVQKEEKPVISKVEEIEEDSPLKKKSVNAICQQRFGVSAETLYVQAKYGDFLFRKKGSLPERIEAVTKQAQVKWGLEKAMPLHYWEQKICCAALRQPEGIKFCGTTWFVERKEDAYR